MNSFITIAITILAYFILVYLWSISKKDFSKIDLAWAGGQLLVLGLSLSYKAEIQLAEMLLAGLVALWCLRLTIHLHLRGKNRGEDFRYQSMRQSYGTNANIQAFFKIFILQAILTIIIAYPFQLLITQTETPSTLRLSIGVAIFLIGLIIEATADYQVYRYKKLNPQGPFFRGGLWNISRHPNYFGEALLWWSIPFFITHPYAFGGPLILSLMLRFVSGVPLLEVKYQNNSAYQEYAKVTPPMAPKIITLIIRNKNILSREVDHD